MRRFFLFIVPRLRGEGGAEGTKGGSERSELIAGGGGALSKKGLPLMIKPGEPPDWAMENYTTSLALAEMHPFWC